MIHSAELKKIKSELKAISIKKPKKPKTLDEIREAQEEVDSQMITILTVEKSIYEDEGKIHFLDVLGLSPRGYVFTNSRFVFIRMIYFAFSKFFGYQFQIIFQIFNNIGFIIFFSYLSSSLSNFNLIFSKLFDCE